MFEISGSRRYGSRFTQERRLGGAAHRKHEAHVAPAAWFKFAVDLAVLAALFGPLGWTGWTYVGIVLLLVASSGAYRFSVPPSPIAEAPGAIARLAVAAAALGAIAWRVPAMGQLLRVLPVATLAFAVGRCVSFAVARRFVSRRLQQVLIAGTGSVGVEFANTLEEHPEYGLQPIGFIDRSADGVLPLPLLGGVEELPHIAEAFGCRNVIVAFGETQEADMVSVLRDCEELGFELWVIPRLYELGVAPVGPHTVDVWGLPLIQIPHDHIRAGKRVVKRAVDILVSSLLLVLGAPVFAGIAIAVKLSSPGSVLFRQPRIGHHGREYELLKFRSMRPHEACHTTWAEEDHATFVGKILRKTSLDELPQLWNVLRGDMSLVGPRPERTHFVRELTGEINGYRERHRVPPGMTGWAQVNGLRGGETSISERVRFDNRYIEHWSIFWDVVIILRTIPAIVREVVSARRERAPKRNAHAGFVYTTERQGEAVRPADPSMSAGQEA